MIVIGSARHDENGKYTNGRKGDQLQSINSSGYDSSGEVSTQPFYVHSKGWVIIRATNPNVANGLAFSMALACINPNIGYSQSDRYGIIKNGILSAVPTNADCSSLVRACVRNCGIEVPDFTTSNAVKTLTSTGMFNKISYSSTNALCNGDILCTKTKGHIVIVVSGATSRSSAKKCQYAVPTSTVRLGDKGDEVKWVQWQLNQHGANLTVDGLFGTLTEKSVKAFQKAHGLAVDGIVGNITKDNLSY